MYILPYKNPPNKVVYVGGEVNDDSSKYQFSLLFSLACMNCTDLHFVCENQIYNARK